MSKAHSPYGTWSSPITVDSLAKEVLAFEDLVVDIITGKVYHTERQPTDARLIIKDTKSNEEVTDSTNNARSLINGYGGRSATIRNGDAFFTNIPDMRIYRTTVTGCIAVTPAASQWRFGDLTIHPSRDVLVCVREDHTDPAPTAVQTTLVSIDLQSSAVKVLSQGWDFYSDPVFSPNGNKLAFTRWNHPDCAFHSLQLVVADVHEQGGSIVLVNEVVVAGEPGKTVAQQPQWLSDEELMFIFDTSDWGQPWVFTVGKGSRPLSPGVIDEDFSEPHWFHGLSSYAVLTSTTVLCTALRNGFSKIYVLDIPSGTLSEVPNSYLVVRQLRRTSESSAVFIGSTEGQGDSIVELSLDLAAGLPPDIPSSFQTLAVSDDIEVDRGFIPRPRDLRLSDNAGRVLHAHYYPPASPQYEGMPGELPPAVISYHSGPNFRPLPGFNWNRLIFTSRGWAWVDIMFAGTTGFGKKYQERLDGHWGVQDVEDVVAGTRQIAELGLIDIQRAVLRGGTAGGYGVLQTCIKYPDLYAAGVSFCGVADLERMQKTVLKFQLHYLDRLVGGTPEEIPEVYKALSPLFHADKIRSPLLLVHGKLDPQVPVEQTEIIAEAVRKAGGRADLIVFEDEAHGFRRAKNVKIAYQAELDLYEEIFGFSNNRSPARV